MASFASNSGRATNVYSSEKVNIRSSKPKSSATLCYVMSGGGIPSRGDPSTNMGKLRERERAKIDKQNLRTHDRLSKVKSTIPKQRVKEKIEKVR